METGYTYTITNISGEHNSIGSYDGQTRAESINMFKFQWLHLTVTSDIVSIITDE